MILGRPGGKKNSEALLQEKINLKRPYTGKNKSANSNLAEKRNVKVNCTQNKNKQRYFLKTLEHSFWFLGHLIGHTQYILRSTDPNMHIFVLSEGKK